MKVFHHPDTLLHDPQHEVLGGRETQYYESPTRIQLIMDSLEAEPENFELSDELDKSLDIGTLKRWAATVHDSDFIEYLESAYADWTAEGNDEAGVFPDAFPFFRASSSGVSSSNKLESLEGLSAVAKAGLYSFDLSCSITKDTWRAILMSLKIVLTGVAQLPSLQPSEGIFCLCRPPGHHAMPSLCGGYCYLNNVAVAAKYLQSLVSNSTQSKIAIIDIDYHHGNGTQDAFYSDSSVLYVSIHGENDYPYFTGKVSEVGEGAGRGFNYNFPLPQGKVDDALYQSTLSKAVEIIKSYSPDFCIVSAGVDTHEEDPISHFGLTTKGYRDVGRIIASVKRPTLFVLEGGYHLQSIGLNIRNLLNGFQMAKNIM